MHIPGNSNFEPFHKLSHIFKGIPDLFFEFRRKAHCLDLNCDGLVTTELYK